MSTTDNQKPSSVLSKRARTPSKKPIEDFKAQVIKQHELDQDDARVKHTSKPDSQISKSLLFEPYRSFGYYTSAIPFSLVKSDQDILLASSVGDHAFYVYNTAKLNLVYMSRFIEQKIVWIEASQDGHIYTALDNHTIV
jgi:hypothetical protein